MTPPTADRVLFVDPEHVGVAGKIVRVLGIESKVQVRPWTAPPFIGYVAYVRADTLRSLEGAREHEHH
jgi:hypothetical protein